MRSRSYQLFATALMVFLAQLCLSVIYPSLPLRLLLGIVAMYFVWRAATVHGGSNSPIGIYIVISSIYVFAALSEVAYFGNRANLDPLLMGELTDMGVAFLICCVGGSLLLEKPHEAKPVQAKVAAVQVKAAVWVCVGILGASIGLTVAALGFAVGELSRSEIYSQDLGLLGLIRSMLAMTFGVAAALLIALEKSTQKVAMFPRALLFGSLGVYILQDLLIFGDRRLPLVALLSVVSLFLRKRFTWTQVLSALLVATLLFAYGYVRNTPPSTWIGTLTSGELLDVISPTSTEFGGMAIIGQTIGDFGSKLWNFPTYFDAFLQVIPRSILPNRPSAPTEWFMHTFFPALSAAGASYAFNQVIEARLNAGIAGIVVVGLLTGMAIQSLSRLRYLGATIGAPLAIYIFCFSVRMDFASLMRTAIVAGLATGLIVAVTAILRLPDEVRPTRRWQV
jgi:hypothetical protein